MSIPFAEKKLGHTSNFAPACLKCDLNKGSLLKSL